MANDKFSMKLAIDKKNNKVLFAEAGKECVDFLFHVLQLPLAKVLTCLSKESGVLGSLGSLYESVKNLKNEYMETNVGKDCILQPRVARGVSPPFPFSKIKETFNAHDVIYQCPKASTSSATYCKLYLSDCSDALCPKCRSPMIVATTYAFVRGNEGGYVKGLVKYTIKDDLEVTPILSSLSSIELFNELKDVDMSCVELREVSVDLNQCLKLLKASLKSKTVLTDVFLERKATEAQYGYGIKEI